MSYTLPELAYDYGALEPHYDGRILELHHKRHHAAYVTGANQALEQLAEARAHGEFKSIVGLERSLAFNLSGHVLHSIFWTNLGPQGENEPQGNLAGAIANAFGSVERCRQQLTHAAVSVQGSGWGALCWESLAKRLIIEQIYDHQGNVGLGSVPILVLDAWEHAYYLKHHNRRSEYIDNIWPAINWSNVAQRYEHCRSLSLI